MAIEVLTVKRFSPVRSRRRGFIYKLVFAGLFVIAASGMYYVQTGSTKVEVKEEMYEKAAFLPFAHDVVERGEVQSSKNVLVASEVRGYRSASTFEILWVIDEGKKVEEGDLLVRLDSSALEEEEKIQRLDVSQAIAAVSKSENELDAAKIAMVEYVDGLFVQEQQELEAQITLANETLRRAEEYYAYSARLAAKGYVTSLQLEGDRFAVEKAKIELANAQRKLDVLEKHTREKKIKELESKIRVAEADLESARERLKIEQKMLNFFLDQIAACTIVAPTTGQVVYANDRGSRESSEFIVEPGAKVRERQTIIRLPDYTSMEINCLINESRVSLVDVGMPVTVKLDAFDELELQGEVIKVNEYPEPISRYGPQVKRYAAVINIDEPPATLKPGLTAQVAIHIEARNSALQVPVQSVYQHGTDYYCMVQGPEGLEARKVGVGSNNSKFVVVDSGLEENDLVHMSPRSIIDDIDLPDLKELDPKAMYAKGDKKRKSKGADGAGRSEDSRGDEKSRQAASNDQVIQKVLSSYDKNKDGKVSIKELTESGFDQLTSFDENGDGILQQDEILASSTLLAKLDARKSKGELLEVAAEPSGEIQ